MARKYFRGYIIFVCAFACLSVRDRLVHSISKNIDSPLILTKLVTSAHKYRKAGHDSCLVMWVKGQSHEDHILRD